MNIKAIFAFFSVLMLSVLMIFVIVNISVPDLIDPGVFRKTVYTFGVLAAGSLLVCGLAFITRKPPHEDAEQS